MIIFPSLQNIGTPVGKDRPRLGGLTDTSKKIKMTKKPVYPENEENSLIHKYLSGFP